METSYWAGPMRPMKKPTVLDGASGVGLTFASVRTAHRAQSSERCAAVDSWQDLEGLEAQKPDLCFSSSWLQLRPSFAGFKVIDSHFPMLCKDQIRL